MDLEPFHRINPCGYQGLAVTQMLDLGGPGSLAEVETVLIGELARQFGLTPVAAAAQLPLVTPVPGDAVRVAEPA
jgi:lipoyl(octanoyl) transferase